MSRFHQLGNVAFSKSLPNWLRSALQSATERLINHKERASPGSTAPRREEAAAIARIPPAIAAAATPSRGGATAIGDGVFRS